MFLHHTSSALARDESQIPLTISLTSFTKVWAPSCNSLLSRNGLPMVQMMPVFLAMVGSESMSRRHMCSRKVSAMAACSCWVWMKAVPASWCFDMVTRFLCLEGKKAVPGLGITHPNLPIKQRHQHIHVMNMEVTRKLLLDQTIFMFLLESLNRQDISISMSSPTWTAQSSPAFYADAPFIASLHCQSSLGATQRNKIQALECAGRGSASSLPALHLFLLQASTALPIPLGTGAARRWRDCGTPGHRQPSAQEHLIMAKSA